MQPLTRTHKAVRPACVIFCLLLTANVDAQIATDGSVGPAQNLSGPDFSIPESLGSRAGGNLFHSFQHFNILTNQSATFSGAADIANVISRVTGGDASTIDGILRSTIGQADFYFLNPAGVVFGANVQVDVPGSFYVSTADQLRFADGSIYHANSPTASTLSFDQPASFGFLGDQTASIRVEGSTLQLTPGQTLSLTGGELNIDDAVISVERGDIQLVSVGDIANTVTIEGNLPKPARGKLTIIDASIIANGDGPGRIVIRSGPSQIDSSAILTDNIGPTDAGSEQGIDIQATSLEIVTSTIATNSFGQGMAADLSLIVEEDLSIVNGGGVSSNTFGAGHAGDVSVRAGTLTIDGQGNDFLTGILSNTLPDSSGNAGTVTVTIDGNAFITDGSQVGSNTFGIGDGGQVYLKAKSLRVSGRPGSALVTGITTRANPDSSGDAGAANVDIDEGLFITNGGQVSSGTFGIGDAGDVIVRAGALTIDRQGSNSVTGIASITIRESGNAGDVTVAVTDAISIENGGEITSSTFGAGNGGPISVTAGTLTIDGQNSGGLTGITSQTNPGSSGNAGAVTVAVDDALSIVNRGTISSSTFSKGDAGQVSVSADSVTIDGRGSDFFTGIASQAGNESLGQTGNVKLDTQTLSLLNGAAISIASGPTVDAATLATIEPTEINITAENITLSDSTITTQSFGNVAAGSITLKVADTLSLDPSRISTAANNADGGAISIQAKVVDLQDSQITTSVTGQGNGGDIDLTANVLVLDSGFIQANTAGANARGGNIRINTDALVASQNSFLIGGSTPLSFQPGLNVIQAAAPDGVSGSIDFTSPQLDISGDLTDLEGDLLDIDQVAQNPCATPGGRQSRLAMLGHGGLPETPEQAGSVIIDADRLQRLLPGTDATRQSPSAAAQPISTRNSTLTIEPLGLSPHAETEC